MWKQYTKFISIFMILSHINLGSCGYPDCSNTYPGQFVSDPDNCHNYYICPDGDGNSEVCPDGGCFLPIGACADATNAYCSTNCPGTDMTTAFTTTGSSTTPTTVTKPTTATTPISVTTNPITIPITTSVQITTTTGETPVTSIPGCDGEYPGTLVPDPNDCHNYYRCGEEGHPPSLETCQDDKCFKPDIAYCSLSYCSICLGTTDITTVSTLSTSATTVTIKTTPTITTTPTTMFTFLPGCNGLGPGAIVPDQKNCHNYYTCYGDGYYEMDTCPNDGCFNSDVSFCQEADTTYCSTHCPGTDETTVSTTTSETTTSSTTATTLTTTSITSSTTKKPVMCGNDVQGTMKPDPTDCHKFFICTSTGQWLRLSCPRNSCFFEYLNTCYENDDLCAAYCDNTVTSTTSTTTPTTSPTTSTKTTTKTTKTTTTSTDTPSDCYDVNKYECARQGYFAKCSYCTPEYFYCYDHGALAQEKACSWPLMFNPDPIYPYCIQPDNCPYPPIEPTTTLPDPDSHCTSISDFNCLRNGYFAKCDYCVPEYYHCDYQNDSPTQGKCSGHMMFNPDPKYPYCVQPYNCPYGY